ncbi:MAG: hypothetical protein R3230_01085 [Nitrosopumilaceae archaeon]|nr:hypothetical protein [Nitrosopumilaceae archaeon]
MTEKLEKMNNGGKQRDERIYRPGFDRKQGIGNATVRLLPAKEGDNFVRQFSHSFKGAGGFYWEVSRTTIGEKDPVGISNALYWQLGEDTGDEKYQNIARKRKRNTRYYMNVYVEKDPNNPECEGKVMIMECGAQIFKAVEDAIKPKYEDEEPIDPFDMWEGAPLKIRASGREIPDYKDPSKKVLVPNYEDTKIGNPCEFLDSDDARKEIFEQTYDLSEFVKVKEFDDLAKRFKKVVGEDYNKLDKTKDEKSSEAAEKAEDDYRQENEGDSYNSTVDDEPEDTKEDEQASTTTESSSDDDYDDALAEFERLASGG